MTIYTLHITKPDRPGRGVTVFFAAEAEHDRTALANALIAVNRLAHALDGVADTLVMGPQQVSDDTVQVIGQLHAVEGAIDPLMVSDTDYQDAYLEKRIAIVGFGGLSDDEQALLEVAE
ncbi:hypothetical protein H6F75_00300 [Nodosilinea sp. FACHB-131]|uniref:hypothetical protein n=1 Tax=Cyanophyceae TaxID=3028117 RepID=UPI001686922B|nr:hypothetical protein [Nodosilinea sp. FACHB-131]MBD1871910.1 hypothetical protein [Nodosilinea sp. FACHB-131]